MQVSPRLRITLKIVVLILIVAFMTMLLVINSKKFSEKSTVTSLNGTKQVLGTDSIITTIPTLVSYLKRKGAVVVLKDVTINPSVSKPGITATINGESMTMYGYKDSKEAKSDAQNIVKSFLDISKKSAVPLHYFRKDILLVEYIGDNKNTLTLFENALGPQIAGE